MELRSRVFKVALATVVGLVAIAGSQSDSQATSEDPELCSAVPGACEYAPTSAPALGEVVCFSSANPLILRSGLECPQGYAAYYVSYGDVLDPQTGEIVAYIRLKDACDMGYCVPDDPNDPPGEEGPMCCDPSTGTCTDTDAICPPNEIAVWCPDGQTAQQGQNGQWECQES